MSALLAAGELPEDTGRPERTSPYGLTGDEAQVGAQVASGRHAYQIAHSMCLNILTVELHRARLMRKLGAQNDLHLVHLLSTLNLPEVRDLVYLDEIQSHYAV